MEQNCLATRLPSPSTLGSSKEALSDVNLCSHGNAEPWGGSRGGAGARRKTGSVDAAGKKRLPVFLKKKKSDPKSYE